MRNRSGFMGGRTVPVRGLGQTAMTLTYEQAKLWAQEFGVMLAAHPECGSGLTRMITDIVSTWDQRLAYLSDAEAIRMKGTWTITLSAEDVAAYHAFKVCTSQVSPAEGRLPSWTVVAGGLAAVGILVFATMD